MRRITLWLLSTVAALVLLFSYRTSTQSGLPANAAAGGTSFSRSNPSSTGSGTSSGNGTSSGSSGSGKTYTGTVAQTRWGPVQVAITVANGKITNISVPTYPDNNGRDREINAYALPILAQETLDSQSANIDTVSGATVTSYGYLESLQAAIDAAHLS
jgi:uncharacterized protein with FMN-binding domain